MMLATTLGMVIIAYTRLWENVYKIARAKWHLTRKATEMGRFLTLMSILLTMSAIIINVTMLWAVAIDKKIPIDSLGGYVVFSLLAFLILVLSACAHTFRTTTGEMWLLHDTGNFEEVISMADWVLSDIRPYKPTFKFRHPRKSIRGMTYGVAAALRGYAYMRLAERRKGKESRYYYLRAKESFEEGLKFGERTIDFCNLAEVSMNLENFQEAEEYLKKARILAKDTYDRKKIDQLEKKLETLKSSRTTLK